MDIKNSRSDQLVLISALKEKGISAQVEEGDGEYPCMLIAKSETGTADIELYDFKNDSTIERAIKHVENEIAWFAKTFPKRTPDQIKAMNANVSIQSEFE